MATWVPKVGSILTACAFVFSVSATPTIIDSGPDPFGDLGLGPQDVLSVGDKAVSAKYEEANDIFVESVTRDGRKRGGEYVEVYNCSVRADISSFNKKDLKDVAVFVDHPEASGLDYALDIVELKDDKFKCMEGTIVFSWTGKPPKRSYSEVILKGFKTGSVPEPATVAFLALGAFGLVGMGTRGRKKE